MDESQQCEDCRRNVPGATVETCPFCGGQVVGVRAPRTDANRRRAPVLNLAVTFCLALVGLRVLLAALGWRTAGASAASSALWTLELIVVLATLLYLLLRRAEGDFRAVFIVAFALFIGAEGLGALSRNYGLAALAGLGSLFNQAQLVYATLALVAAAGTDAPRGLYHRALVAASTGILLMGLARLCLELFYREREGLQNLALALVLLGLGAYLTVLLAWGEKRPKAANSGSAAGKSDLA